MNRSRTSILASSIFAVTLEQQFITTDDLLTEEAVDPFTDNAMAKDVIAACIQLDTSLLFDSMIAHHLTLEPIVFDINMMIEPHIDPLQCIDNDEDFCATMGRDTDAADGDDSDMRPTIPRAFIELYAYISYIQDPDNPGTLMQMVDSSVDLILAQENARLLTQTHGRALPLHCPETLSLIQVEDNMTYIVCTPGASCQAMLLFSRENRQVFWSTSSIAIRSLQRWLLCHSIDCTSRIVWFSIPVSLIYPIH
jgi:hypothetical protein